MSTKHLYDSPDGLVLKSLRGAVAVNPGLWLHELSKTVFTPFHSSSSSSDHNSNGKRKRVAVIAGGGAGHEPAHAGYTGRGMLSAAVAGEIFASPSARQVGCAIELAAFSGCAAGAGGGSEGAGEGEGGDGAEREQRDVLVVINNYTGDMLNFGLAIETARLAHPSLGIASVVVADDVSLLAPPSPPSPDSTSSPPSTSPPQTQPHTPNTLVGPRGLAANILVCKVLGALAESGAGLGVVKAYGDAVAGNLVSVGVGLEHCHVPGRDKPKSESETQPKSGGDAEAKKGEDAEAKKGGDTGSGSGIGSAIASGIGEGECELGLGLHNEPGVRRRKVGDPRGLVGDMVGMVLDGRGMRNGGAGADGGGDEGDQGGWVLFINNLGGMSQLEMGAVVDDTLECLANEHNIHPKRIYASAYMTSLNAPGFSISLLDVGGVRWSLEVLFDPLALSSSYSRMQTQMQMPSSQRQAPVILDTYPHPNTNTTTSAQRMKKELLKINLYDLLDAPTDATAWVGARRWREFAASREEVGDENVRRILGVGGAGGARKPVGGASAAAAATAGVAHRTVAASASTPPSPLEQALRGACHSVLRVQAELTEFDTVVGDGDCGDTFGKGAKGILQALDSGTLVAQYVDGDLAGVVSRIADILEDSMGGTVGALFAIFLNALSASLASSISYHDEHEYEQEHQHEHQHKHQHQHETSKTNMTASWAPALSIALGTLGKYTPAKPGDRTIVDALKPFCDCLGEAEAKVSGEGAEGEGGTLRDLRAFREAVKRAREGAERTRGMRAGLGRAVYVDSDFGDAGVGGEGEEDKGQDGQDGQERRKKRELPPDPGAWGVAAILEGLLEGLEGEEGVEGLEGLEGKG